MAETPKVIKIEGMDCADCVARIEEAVNRVDGVKSARAYLGSSSLAVIPEDENLDMSAVTRAIKKLGYGR